MLAMTENMTKLEKIVISTRNVHMVSVAPRMRVVSTKHVPTMFPKDMSACPLRIARTLAIKTDTLVPKATTVPPMTAGATCKLSAMDEAESTMKYETKTVTIALQKVRSAGLSRFGFGSKSRKSLSWMSFGLSSR